MKITRNIFPRIFQIFEFLREKFIFLGKMIFLHRKYERTKEVIAGCLKNEEILKARESEITQKYNHSLERFKALQEHADGKLQQ